MPRCLDSPRYLQCSAPPIFLFLLVIFVIYNRTKLGKRSLGFKLLAPEVLFSGYQNCANLSCWWLVFGVIWGSTVHIVHCAACSKQTFALKDVCSVLYLCAVYIWSLGSFRCTIEQCGSELQRRQQCKKCSPIGPFLRSCAMLSRPQRLLSGQDTWLSCLSTSCLIGSKLFNLDFFFFGSWF